MLKKVLCVIISIALLFSNQACLVYADEDDALNEKTEFNGNSYQLFSGAETWEEASLACEEMGGHLATIGSQEENVFLYAMLIASGNLNAYFGFTDSGSEGNWRWVTGEEVTYTNWASGEPNNQLLSENYAMFYYMNPDGTWNDGDFGGNTLAGETNYICEWEGEEQTAVEAMEEGAEVNPDGFIKNRDGWALANASEAFGYSDDYKIPVSRYCETYGISLSSLVLGGATHIFTKWSGSCFGLSLLAIAQYNDQIDLTGYFPNKNEEGLYNFGYNSIKTITKNDSTGEIFTVEGNTDITEAIERAFISQDSQELKKAEVFSGDKTYSRLINYLSRDDARPLLVNLTDGWNGHSMVIRNDIEPIRLSETSDWYYIPVYDCNQPSNSDLLQNPYSWYTQEDSALLVNTEDGSWQYLRDESLQISSSYSFLTEKRILFYDISLLNDSYFTDALTLFGNLIKLDFSGNDISITDNSGNILFQIADGAIEYIDDACEYMPRFGDDMEEGTLCGTIELPSDVFNCSVDNGEIAVYSEDSYISLSTEGQNDISVDTENCSVEKTGGSSDSLYIALQENVSDKYNAVSLSGKTGEDKTLSVSLDNGSVITSGTETEKFNVSTETNADDSQEPQLQQYEGLGLDEINTVEIDGVHKNKGLLSGISSFFNSVLEFIQNIFDKISEAFTDITELAFSKVFAPVIIDIPYTKP
ncbi:MAG: hypothetical protein LIO87_01405 [Eubacterium sp.]|nr:hypothetical protein [Eubacterium sp.]